MSITNAFQGKHSKTLLIIACVVLIITVSGLGYLYSPIMFVVPRPDINGLINQLASENEPPVFPGSPRHFFQREFFQNPGSWDPAKQQKVTDAYSKLQAMGTDAFPYLINKFEDDRYSHEHCSSTYTSVSVGQACKRLIERQVDIRGIRYKSRETPGGSGMGLDFDEYVYSNYGSYAAWWRINRFRSLKQMRIAVVRWRISEEKWRGFVSTEQRNSILGSLNEDLQDASDMGNSLQVWIPQHSIDALVNAYQERKRYSSPTNKTH
jgi:hypothetical protein